MRNNELYEGIEVFDKDNKVVATSRIAAKKVIFVSTLNVSILFFFLSVHVFNYVVFF